MNKKMCWRTTVYQSLIILSEYTLVTSGQSVLKCWSLLSIFLVQGGAISDPAIGIKCTKQIFNVHYQ